MIKDLGDWAEDRFSALCAAAGVTRNKSTQDRSGWDYIIQFPLLEVADVPADMLPGEDSARIQIKSKENGRPVASLKLTNALRFAKESTPCFIILFLALNRSEPVRIYAKHFWASEIEAALRRARLADYEDRTDLHKITVSIRFDEKDEHSADLLGWIAQTIRAVDGSYAGAKAAINNSLGFEKGAIHGTISFTADNLEALIDHQIGLTPSAPITDITVRHRRFGTDARKPIFSGKPVITELRSHPVPCRVRVRGLDGSDIWLEGSLFRPALPGIPLKLMKLRVVADFLELIISGDRKGDNFTGDINFTFNAEEQRTIAGLRAFIDVAGLAENGPLQIQISGDRLPHVPLSVILDPSWNKDQRKQFSNVIACLEVITSGVEPADLTLSFAEISAAWDATLDFHGLVTGSNLRGSFTCGAILTPAVPLSATSIFLYDYVDIGRWTFLTVVRRPLTRFVLREHHGEFHCGAPRIVEAMVKCGSGKDHGIELQELYRQAVASEGSDVLQLFGGSYRTMLMADKQGIAPAEASSKGS